jgi:hypothetical protein
MTTYTTLGVPFLAVYGPRARDDSAPVVPHRDLPSLLLRREELPRVGRRESYPPRSYDDCPKHPLPTL